MNNNYKFIHLLYVPTMNCNMKCKYCYLKENTVDLEPDDKYLKTLEFATKKFKDSNVIPFNISLHGGEVTTLSKIDFRNLIKYIHKACHNIQSLLITDTVLHKATVKFDNINRQTNESFKV